MSAPRHLWSGEWQLDSAAVAEELARRRARSEQPEPPAPPPEQPPRGPSARERLLAALGELRRRLAAVNLPRMPPGAGRRLGLAVAVAAVLVAAVALGASALSGHSSASQPAGANRGWLGISMTSAPNGGGATISAVAPASPARMAGLQPGDVITQINNQTIQTPSDVTAALDGLLPGNQIQIQFNRGFASFSTLATLVSRRSAGP